MADVYIQVRANSSSPWTEQIALAAVPLFFLPGVTGLTGGGATKLDGVATVNLPVGLAYAFVDSGGVLHIYQLTAGTTAAASPGIIRPADYDGTTNAKIWTSEL